MALIILEGLDRTGKSSVAQWYENQGYEVMHMSAPPKGISQDEYLGEMVDLLSSLSGKDVVLDRSHYGELVWPGVYGRKAVLDDDAIEVLREIEATMDVSRILMHDNNSEAHWQRCVDNNEPLTKVQFVKARSLYSSMADKYGFIRKTLKDFPDAVQPLPNATKSPSTDKVLSTESVAKTAVPAGEAGNSKILEKTREQQKLDRANAINEVLSKRLIKGKGEVYDDLERSVRHFLNGELGKIFGNAAPSGFTAEETDLLKFFVQRLKEKKND